MISGLKKILGILKTFINLMKLLKKYLAQEKSEKRKSTKTYKDIVESGDEEKVSETVYDLLDSDND
ncbi:MAG: hypothetical protein ACTSQY_08735 [Candidatus Odinarchaeia archaeon]